MAFFRRSAYKLTETEIRYAMANSAGNADACRFLHVSMTTWKKYAGMYYDHETGKTLYQLHKNQGRNFQKIYSKKSKKILSVESILSGEHPTFPIPLLQQRLIESGTMPDNCSICGFGEQRLTDYKTPILLMHKNGDRQDHRLENIEFVCYNCFHLYYGEMRVKRYLKYNEIKRFDVVNENYVSPTDDEEEYDVEEIFKSLQNEQQPE